MTKLSFPKFNYHNITIVRPVGVGHETINSNSYSWDNEKHGTGEQYGFFQYTLSGTGHLLLDNNRHKCERECGFLCTTDHHFKYWFDKATDSTWEFLWIGFSGTSAISIIKSIQTGFGKFVKLPISSRCIHTIYELYSKANKNQWHNETELSSMGYLFLLQLIEDLRKKHTNDTTERIDESAHYIKTHFDESISVELLALRYGYSREHFSRLFSQRIGLSPTQYILDCRLEQAKRLVCENKLSLKQIADKCGLKDANYLCSLFRKRYKTSPRQYPSSIDAVFSYTPT